MEAMFNLLMGVPSTCHPEHPRVQDVIDFCMLNFGCLPKFDDQCRLVGKNIFALLMVKVLIFCSRYFETR